MADPRTERRRGNRRRARRAFILDGTRGIFESLEPRLLLATDVWTGAVSGNWSVAGNWQSGSAPSAGDDLDFPSGASNLTNTNDFSANTLFNSIEIDASGYTIGGNAIDLGGGISATYGSGTSTLSADLALQASEGVNVDAGGTLILSGVISGTGYGITLGGPGTLVLAGSSANTYTGTTTVNDGTLELDAPASTNAIAGDLVIGDNTHTPTVQLEASNQIPDTSNVTVNQVATFDLNGFNASIAGLTVQGATVLVPTGSTLGLTSITSDVPTDDVTSTISGAGDLQLDEGYGTLLPVAVAQDTNLAVDLSIGASIIGDNRGLDKSGAGTLALSGSSSNYDNNTIVEAGVIQIESDGALGNTNAAVTVSGASFFFDGANLSFSTEFNINGDGVGGAGALDVISGSTTLALVGLEGDAQLGAASGATLTIGDLVDNTGPPPYVNLAIGNGATGRTILDGPNNTFGGNIDVLGGCLRASDPSALGNSGASATITLEIGASFELSGGIEIPATKSLVVVGTGADSGTDDNIINIDGDNTIDGSIQIQSNTSVNVAADTTLTLSGDISESDPSTNLSKDGAGILVLSGTGSYTGDTTINDGTMRVDGDISASDVVYVNPGATLDGTGTVPAPSVGGDGTITPGDGGPGILNTGVLGLSPSSIANFVIDGPTAGSGYGQVVVSGTASVVIDSATLSLDLGYTPAIGTQFTLISNDTGQSLIGAFAGLPNNYTFTQGNVTFQISYFGGTDANSVVLTVTDVTYTWSGGDDGVGGNDNWSTPSNWVGDVAPTPGARLIFPSGADQLTTNDDLGTGFDVNTIDVDGSGYTITGDSIDLDAGIATTYASGTSTVALDTTLTQTGTFDVADGGTLDLSGVITVSNFGGGYGVTEDGGGTLEYSGSSANLYNGTTIVNAGTLLLAKSDDVISANGDVIVGDGTTAATLQLGGSDQFWVGANVTVNEGSTFDVGTETAHISNLNLEGSTVQIDSGGVLATFVGINTTVPTNDVTSLIQGQGALQIDNSANMFTIAADPDLAVDLSISTVIQGLDPTSGFSKYGAGTLALSGDNTFGGDTEIDSGTVIAESDTALGSDSGTVTVQGGASLWLEGDTLSIANPLNITGDGVDIRGAIRNFATSATLSGDVTLAASPARVGSADATVLDFTGTINSQGENYLLTVDNDPTGKVILDADNTTDGDINVTGGILEATHDNSFGDPGNADVVTITNGGASIELSGGISTPPTKSLVIQGSGADSGADDNIINASGDNTFGGGIQLQANSTVSVATGTTLTLLGDITQSGPPYSLSKDDAGTLVLTGTGSYTGDTTINDGTMRVDGDISASDVVYVNPGATLDGTGTVPAPSVGGDGTITPGDGGPGILNTGVLGLSPSSIASFDLDGPTVGSGYSQLVVSGSSSVVIDNGTLSLDLGYTPAIGTQFTLISNDTGQSLIGAFDGLANNQTFTRGNVTFQISYFGGEGDNSVVLTVTDVVYTWSGGDAADGYWSRGDNWVGDVAPTSGARLIFPSDAPRTSNVNNLSPNFSVYEIDFQASGYAIAGNAIDLDSGVLTTYGSGTSTVTDALALQSCVTTDVATSGTLVLSGAISGSGKGLTKTGDGTLEFGGLSANTYSGTTYVNAGTLLLDHPASVTAVQGNLIVGDNVGTGAAVEVMVDDQIANTADVTVNQEATLSVDTGVSEQFTDLTLQDATVDLASGASLDPMYGLEVNAGSDHIGSLIQGAGIFVLQGTLIITVADDPDVAVDLRVSAEMGNPTNGSGALAKTGPGTMAISGDNTYTGRTYVQSGVLIIEDSNAVATGDGDLLVFPGGSLVFSGDNLDIPNSFLTISGTGDGGLGAVWVASGSATLSGDMPLGGDTQLGAASGASLTLSGAISGDYNLFVANGATGSTTLVGDNTFGGSTTVTDGYLEAADSNAFGDPTASTTVTIDNGASLELSGGIAIPATKSLVVQGTGADDGADDPIINLDGDNTFGGDIQIQANTSVSVATDTTLTLPGDINQAGSFLWLSKDGAGTLVLSGTGASTLVSILNAGTTQVDGDFSAGAGATVNAGATMSGTGSVAMPVVMDGGTVAPGDGGPGILNTGPFNTGGGSIVSFVIDGATAGTDYSQIVATGGVYLYGATLSLSIGDDFQAASGATFTLIHNVTNSAVGGTFDGLAEGTIFAVQGQAFQISYIGGDGNDVTLTAVPIAVTPTTLLAPAAGSAYSEQLTASGGSGTGYTFSATGLPAGLSISASGLITGTPTTANPSPVTVEVTVTDSIDSATTDPVTIVVNPAIAATPTTLVAPTAGSAYSEPLTGTGGSGSGYTYSATGLPDGLSISDSGWITGTPTTPDATPVSVQVTITDGNGMSAVQIYSITVNQPLAVTPATLPTAAVDSFYTLQLGATGGSGSGYTYSATGLPDGLSISGSGLIGGTPLGNSDSPYTIDVTVTDGDGASATLPVTLTIGDALAITPSTLPSPAVGTPYSQQLAGSGGSDGGYTYSATGLPPGLTITPGGLIGGIPTTVAGSPFEISVTITDGDGNSGAIPFTVTAVAGSSTTSLASSANPAIVGQSFTLTATVSAFQPGSVLPEGGTVTFRDGDTVLGGAPVVDGVAQILVSSLSAGPHTLTATFNGNPDFQASLSPAMALTSLYASVATFTVAGTGSTASPPVTFTLAIAPQGDQVATGTVQFFGDGALIGTAPLDSQGVATFTTSAIAAGSQTFTATYSGDDLFAGATSSQSFTVGKAQSQGGDLTSSAPQVYYGQTVTLTATFTATYNGSAPMTGTVAFYDGTTYLGTATLSSSPPNDSPTAAVMPAVSPAIPAPSQVSGQATLPNVTLTVGDHNIRAVYSGDAYYAPVTSITPVSVAVQQATTATTLAVGAGVAGTTILTATIVPTSPATPTLTGTVAFYDGTTYLGTAPLIDQVATFNAGVLTAGAHSFTAVFSGGAESSSSGSSAVIYTPPANGPTVTSIRRFGRHCQPTYVVLTFSGTLAPARAENVNNYQVVKLNRHGKPMGGSVLIKVAAINVDGNTVTLAFAHRLSRTRHFRVTVLGSSATGIMGTSGQPLNASPAQVSGSDYVGLMTKHNYAGSARLLPAPVADASKARS